MNVRNRFHGSNGLLSAAAMAAFFAVLAFGWTPASAASVWGSPAARAADETLAVRVGVYDNPPKISMDDKGQAVGFWPDILNVIAAKEGWRLEYVKCVWADCLAKLQAGELDIMPDVGVFAARQEIYDFNAETPVTNWGLVYARKGLKMESFFDLGGKRIAVMDNDIHYVGPAGLKTLLASFNLKAEIVVTPSYGDVLKAVQDGRADLGVVNQIFGITEEAKYDVARTNIVFDPVELRFAFPKGAEKNARLIAAIDDDLRQMKADPNSVYHQSLTRNFLAPAEKVEVLPGWVRVVLWCLLGAAALTVLYLALQMRIRKRLEVLVKERTRDLEKEKQKFQRVFYGSHDALLIKDGKTQKITDCNDAAVRLFGYASQKEMVGLSSLELSAPKQMDGRPAETALAEIFAKLPEQGGTVFEWLQRRKDGSEFSAVVALTPLAMGDEYIVHTSMRDLTEIKLAEDKVRALDRLKSRFVTVLTHVIRTPLNKIRWAMESLAGGDFGEVSKEGQSLIKQTINSDQEILGLIDDMGLVLDLERGSLVLNQTPTSLQSLVFSVKKAFTEMPDCEGIRCEMVVPKTEPPAVNIDAERVRRVLETLLDNAKRYLTRPKKEIRIELSERDGRVRCSVSDTGIGIPKAEQSYIFDRFFRASNAMTAYADGTGIGLFIAKSIVEAHGGSIGFESKEGEGTTFWLEFPAVKARTA